jgi:hypothetical protein
MSRSNPSPLPYLVPLPLLSPHLERLLVALLHWLPGLDNCHRWLTAHATGCGITRAMRQEVEDLEQFLDDALGSRQSRRHRRLAMLRTGREDH